MIKLISGCVTSAIGLAIVYFSALEVHSSIQNGEKHGEGLWLLLFIGVFVTIAGLNTLLDREKKDEDEYNF